MVKLVGTGGTQVPTNNMLGNMAFQNKEGVAVDLLGLAAGTAAAPSLIPTGDPNTGVWFPAADTVAVSTNGLERLQINSSGNVGIGTTSPTSTLHVRGGAGAIISIFDSSTAADTRLELRNNNTRSGYFYWDASEVRFFVDTSRFATFYTNASERMRITTTGDIGIGQTSVTAVFGRTVSATNSSGATMRVAGVTVSGYMYSSEGLGVFGVTSETNHPLVLSTNSAERMRITNSGNVGIGTASPLAKLDVAGFVRSGGDATFRGDIVIQQQANSAAGTGGLELKSDAGSAGYGARILTIFDGVSTYNLGFQTRSNSATWSTQMVVTSAGNVGIGTITPTQKLDVVGTGTFSVSVNTPFITFGGTTSAFPALKRSSTTLQVRLADDTADAPLSASTINATTIPANTPAIASSGFSLTGNNAFSLMDLAGQWNTTGNPSAIRLNVTNIASGASSLLMELGTTDIGVYTARFTVSKAGNVTLADGGNLSVGLSTGTKIGTATSQKIGFWNVTPIIQPTTSVAAATFVANSGTAVNDASTFDGYTISKVVKALRNLGILA